MNPNGPLIIQSDGSILLEVDHSSFEGARDAIAPFAELEKSPEHMHTYRLTRLSIWNAASSGLGAEEMLESLTRFSKYEVPSNIAEEVRTQASRYGCLKLYKDEEGLRLVSEDDFIINEIVHHKKMAPYVVDRTDRRTIRVDPANRGLIKQALIHIGFPVEDLAGYSEGDPLPLELRGFEIRDYQRRAIDAFWAGGGPKGGSGVLVLPCGSGKTVIGLGVMSLANVHTLILTPNVSAVRQWKSELAEKTDIDPDLIGEYSGDVKNIQPITVSTYQILTYRKKKTDPFAHFGLFDEKNWGLIVYDEVHLLPAPVFRAVANLQAKRRLGLTATLVREDRLESDVFSLIGPKKFDAPWKDLEERGWIAQADCVEVRLTLPEEMRMEYAVAGDRAKYRMSASNPQKIEAARRIVEAHPGKNILIIGQYLDQLREFNKFFDVPLITGSTPNAKRDELYGQFRKGEIRLMIVSKVANFSIDLPDASVAIEISGSFGSRQEEAQRLGRILRPKPGDNRAHFYALVTKDTRDQEFSANRQRFLTEQGYRYRIASLSDWGAA